MATNTPRQEKRRANAPIACSLEGKTKYELVGDQGNWVGLIAPGIGLGWVHATTIRSRVSHPRLAQVANPTTNERVASFSLTTAITLSPSREENARVVAAIEMLVALIGPPLHELHLPNHNVTDALLAHILGTCPHLSHLNVSGHTIVDHLRSLSFVIGIPKARRGSARNMTLIFFL